MTRPTFNEVYGKLEASGPASVVSSHGTVYSILAHLSAGARSIVASPGTGQVTVHEDCWGDGITCDGEPAEGIYNGDPSIYDWYARSLHA